MKKHGIKITLLVCIVSEHVLVMNYMTKSESYVTSDDKNIAWMSHLKLDDIVCHGNEHTTTQSMVVLINTGLAIKLSSIS